MGNRDSNGRELWEPGMQHRIKQIWDEEQRAQNIENVGSVNPEDILDTSVAECEEYLPTNFVWSHGGTEVRMVTSADAWANETIMYRTTNNSGRVEFSAVVEMPPGLHWYKFVVDEVWACARDQPFKRELEGGYVNYIRVRSFSMQSLISEKLRETNDEWGTSFKFEHLRGSLPQAPPHLGAILLNVKPSATKHNEWDTKPNHCVHGHLYLEQTTADDLMVLGTTERYRDKAYTTVMYRPKLRVTSMDTEDI